MSFVADLPGWIAVPVSRAVPEEEPSVVELRATVRAWTQLAVVRMLAEALRDPPLAPTVHANLTQAFEQEADLDAWADLLGALMFSGYGGALGLSDRVPAAVQAIYDAWEVSDPVGLVSEVIARDTLPDDLGAAVAALTLATRALARSPPCWVVSAATTTRGWQVRFRRLTGIADFPLQKAQGQGGPPVPPDCLCFWDGAGPATVVPRWLATWDPTNRTMLLCVGQRGGTWLYANAMGAVQSRVAPAGPLPGALVSVDVPTPADERVKPTAAFSPDFLEGVHAALALRDEAPEQSEAPAPDSRLILRVIAGPFCEVHAVLEPDVALTIGRDDRVANVHIRRYHLSRAHTRVRMESDGSLFVADLGSTNGTVVDGGTVAPNKERPLQIGQIMESGPLLTRVEWATPDAIGRLEQVLGFVEDASRDALTGLLSTADLEQVLPTGGSDLWGVLIYVCRLDEIHTQLGEEVADGVFRQVARGLQRHMDEPDWVTRVAYGEILAPIRAVDRSGAEAVLDSVLERFGTLRCEIPVRSVGLLGVVERREPAEPVSDWLIRTRKLLNELRQRGGSS